MLSNTDLIDPTHLITKAILITRLSTPKCKCFSRKSVIKIKIQKPARRLEATECCYAYGALHAVRIWYCYQNCSDLLWEKNVLVIEKKLLKFEAEDREFAKFLRSLEIIRTIYSNSVRSEPFLVTECFFNLFLEVSHI